MKLLYTVKYNPIYKVTLCLKVQNFHTLWLNQHLVNIFIAITMEQGKKTHRYMSYDSGQLVLHTHIYEKTNNGAQYCNNATSIAQQN